LELLAGLGTPKAVNVIAQHKADFDRWVFDADIWSGALEHARRFAWPLLLTAAAYSQGLAQIKGLLYSGRSFR